MANILVTLLALLLRAFFFNILVEKIMIPKSIKRFYTKSNTRQMRMFVLLLCSQVNLYFWRSKSRRLNKVERRVPK